MYSTWTKSFSSNNKFRIILKPNPLNLMQRLVACWLRCLPNMADSSVLLRQQIPKHHNETFDSYACLSVWTALGIVCASVLDGRVPMRVVWLLIRQKLTKVSIFQIWVKKKLLLPPRSTSAPFVPGIMIAELHLSWQLYGPSAPRRSSNPKCNYKTKAIKNQWPSLVPVNVSYHFW